MRSLIAIPITLLLAFFMSACTKKETALFVIQAPHVQVVGDKEAGYKLILEEPHDTVIWFSDRPERSAGYIHIRDLLKAWDEGKNSFDDLSHLFVNLSKTKRSRYPSIVSVGGTIYALSTCRSY